MALKDLLQSQKTIRELKTAPAALRLEKAEAARQKKNKKQTRKPPSGNGS